MSDSEAQTSNQNMDGSDKLPSAVGVSVIDQQSFWSAIRESLRGSHRDYTVGPIGRSIIMLAIPMVLEMCMESIFAVVDIKWVSYLGH